MNNTPTGQIAKIKELGEEGVSAFSDIDIDSICNETVEKDRHEITKLLEDEVMYIIKNGKMDYANLSEIEAVNIRCTAIKNVRKALRLEKRKSQSPDGLVG